MLDSRQAWKTDLGHSSNRQVGSPAPIVTRRPASPVPRTQTSPTRQRLALTPVRALHKSGFLTNQTGSLTVQFRRSIQNIPRSPNQKFKGPTVTRIKTRPLEQRP